MTLISFLLFLAYLQPLELSDSILPICLPSEFLENSDAIVNHGLTFQGWSPIGEREDNYALTEININVRLINLSKSNLAIVLNFYVLFITGATMSAISCTLRESIQLISTSQFHTF